MFDQYVRSEYRNDIQGLRAVGAIIIMVFHIWFNKVSGGVDVFFVISGFLMSSILLKDFFVHNTVNPFPFWAGIIKRVAPSAYLVLIVTLITSYFILSPVFLSTAIRGVIASALHLENINLIRGSVDYLSSGTPPSPTQQFWALSIQIQFYIALPFILIPLALLSKKKGDSLPLVLGVTIITITSFIYAVISVGSNPTGSYFSPISRIWEFLFGVLSFLFVSNFNRIKYKQVLGVIGITLIVGGAILIPRGAGFPGFISLIPVLGAAFIVVSGTNGYKGIVNKALSSKALVFLGGMSFTIYLWHWPILILYKDYFGYQSLNVIQGLSIIFASIILAYVTSKNIEFPFKKIPKEKIVKNFAIGIFFFLPVITLAFAFKHEVSSIVKESKLEIESKSSDTFSGDKVYLENATTRIDRKTLLSVNKIVPASYTLGCNQENEGTEAKTCSFGDVKSSKEIILVGSSHATQWLPALDEIGKKENFKIINMTKSSCSFGVSETSDESCHEWNRKAVDKIIRMKPYAVITNSTITSNNKEERILKSSIETWRKLDSNGIDVIGIRDNPRFNFNIPECIHNNRNSSDSNTCSMDRADALLKADPTIQYKDIIKNIDMSNMFCTETKCLATFDGKLMYRDSNHISVEFMYFIQDYLKENLRNIFADIDKTEE